MLWHPQSSWAPPGTMLLVQWLIMRLHSGLTVTFCRREFSGAPVLCVHPGVRLSETEGKTVVMACGWEVAG